jgi:hypothetical protein
MENPNRLPKPSTQSLPRKILIIEKESTAFVKNALDKEKIPYDITDHYRTAFKLAEDNPYSIAIVPDSMNFTEGKVLPKLQQKLNRLNPYTKLLVMSPIADNVLGLIEVGEFNYPLPTVMQIPATRDQIISQVKGMITSKSNDCLKELILKIINNDGKLNDSNLELIFSEIDKRRELINGGLETLTLNQNGFTSRSGFEFGKLFFKVDIPERIEHEAKVYNLDLNNFNKYRPNFVGYANDENTGVLILENVIRKINPSSLDIRNNLKHSIQAMSIFHREMLKYQNIFAQLRYYGIHNIPHFEEGNIPHVNDTGEGYKKFEETQIDIRKVKPIIEEYLKMQKIYGNSVIHGDWKRDNIVNNHLVDYAMTGLGFEIDELAYFLSDSKYEVSPYEFKTATEFYIDERIKHDPEFHMRIMQGYGKQIEQLIDSAFLSQLVLRHSVMNKRDLLDPEKFQQRQYYKHRISQVLTEGKFI